jgi:thermitase
MTDQGNTPNSPLPDLRTREQRAGDRAAVERQVRALSPPPAGFRTLAGAGLDILDLLRRRQAGVGGGGLRFDVHDPDDGAIPALVVQNELVVETDDQPLSRYGDSLTDYEVRASRPGRKARVFRWKGKTATDPVADARLLRDQNIEANVSQIVPLGYVVKGDTFPGRTTVSRPFQPGTGGSPVRVAVIDTGLTDQPRTDGWFTGITRRATDQLNQVKPEEGRNDFFAGHGTFTAGIVRQLSSTCEIVVYRFTRTDGLGTDTDAADMLIKAADDAAAEAPGQRLIINASFGAPAVDGQPPLALRDAVDYIAREYPDVLIVASAGNDGSDQRLYPAGFEMPNVRAVGALNPDRTKAGFSNYGNWVHCSAVGVGVVSTFVKGLTPPEAGMGVPDIDFPAMPWATWTGTSFTAPQISGAVARLCAENPGLKPRAAFDQLLRGRPKLPNSQTVVVHLLEGTAP